MMAALIIAVRGTVGQAVLLGLAATVSRTAVVWLVALAGPHLGRNFDAETSEPYFQVASVPFILGVALWMVWRTITTVPTMRPGSTCRRAASPNCHRAPSAVGTASAAPYCELGSRRRSPFASGGSGLPQKARLRPPKKPRRAPNCGAPTPMPLPSRSWYRRSKALSTSKRSVHRPPSGSARSCWTPKLKVT